MTQEKIQIKNLTKSFGKITAIKNLSLEIPCGKMIGIVGPDGSGKTTLMRLLAALMLPSYGSITWAGLDSVKHSQKIQENIGYMPQRFGLYEDLTVLQNLNLYMELKGVDPKEQKLRVEKLLNFTQLTPFTSRFAKNLSGGMKQKLGLACSLLSRPPLLLLDEPSVGVDPISRRELWKMVQELFEDHITVVWSTAYLDEAERCDEVVLLNQGELLFSGAPSELKKRVENRVFYVSGIKESPRKVLNKFLNKEEVIDGVIEGDGLRVVVAPNADLTSSFFKEYHIASLAPRFEDGFIDILGGGPGGRSLLAEQSPQIEMQSDIAIEAKNLTKKFGSFTAVNQINFKVKKGAVFGLLGPNGAGKSTTFKMLCGLLKPTSGETHVISEDLYKAKGVIRGQIGYMAQKFSLYENLSLYQNLKIFSGFYNLFGAAQKESISEMIKIFEFSELKDQTVEMLPLGFKQRLSLACAVMHHPKVLFLDEPTSGVDPITRRDFWNHINGLVDKGTTVILTTHFMDEAENCDEIALVYAGNIINVGSPHQLKEIAKSKNLETPTLEDAFIELISRFQSEKKA